MKDGIRLPESVKIAWHSFTIRYPYIFRETSEIWGQCDHGTKEIRISNLDCGGQQRPASGIYVTLIHELLHAIDGVSGQNVFDEPKIVALSELIYQVLTDNGWLKVDYPKTA